MKNLIKIAFCLLCFFSAGSLQSFAQGDSVEIINDLSDDIEVTIFDICTPIPGSATITVPALSSVTIPMPGGSGQCSYTMASGEFRVLGGGPCTGVTHPICPPGTTPDCPVCVPPNTIFDHVVHYATGWGIYLHNYSVRIYQ